MTDYEKEHSEMIRRSGAECTLMLKSDGSFPLDAPCAIALYGSGARRTVKGGTGSGEVNSRCFATAEDGLAAAGFTVTTGGWMDSYDHLRAAAKKKFIRGIKRDALRHGTLAVLTSIGAVMPEPEYDLPADAPGEAAVYVLSRISGEGSDRKPVPGDILLTETEKRDILEFERRFEKFLLVLNTGGPVDLSPVMDVRNILLLGQLGAETGNILADLILGRSYPSGKLAATWSAWEDHPSAGGFGDRFDTHYTEGIYVGYRYFDSAGKKPLFPFGFGLGYTGFSVETGAARADGCRISLDAAVSNTGARRGKEVVQLYVSQPQGKLDKPYQALAAFEKTEELAPGAEQTLTLSFDLRDLASYDTERAAWILEPGDYVLRAGTSSRDTKAAAIVRLEREVLTRQVRNCLGDPGHADWKPEQAVYDVPAGLPVIQVDPASIPAETVNYDQSINIDPLAEVLSDEELCLLNIGAFESKSSKSVVGNAAHSVPGAAGETVGYLKDIPAMVMADGPAGLRLARQCIRDENGIHAIDGGMPESIMEMMPAPAAFFMKHFGKKPKADGEIFEQNCTAIPVGTALAQSWNLSFAEQCGDIVGDEMERFGVRLWLAPALNIHRDIRCGRNFEYYSEDPLISGLFAAAVTRGVQRHPGCGTTIKHFAANNQETNRYGSNSLVSERAMREIYLRGFETAVKKAAPHAVMTSYNLLNGIHTSEHRGLIEDILRCEFGFEGIVMTDWIISAMYSRKNKYPAPNAARTAAAGGGIVMPGGRGDLKAMKKGLEEGLLTREQLLAAATRVIRMAKKQ